jgi:hypothetical protein
VTADAQVQLAEVELVEISVDDVQLLTTEVPAGVGEPPHRWGVWPRSPTATSRSRPIGSRPRVDRRHAATVRVDLPQLRDLARGPARSPAAGRRSRRRSHRRLRSPSGRSRRPQWSIGGAGDCPRVRVDGPRARVRARSQGPGRRCPRPASRARTPETLTDADSANLLRVPIVAVARAGATTRCCACSATAACAPPRCDDYAPRISAAQEPTPGRPALRAQQGRPRARGLSPRRRQGRDRRLGSGTPEAVYRLVNRDCLAAGVPGRLDLAHPHALRSYWATRAL